MKKIFLLFFLISSYAFSQMSSKDLLDKIDKAQRNYNTFSFSADMTINSQSRVLKKNFFGYVENTGNKAFMEYTNPQDNGTRYLKLGEDMWIYFPNAADVLKISGHLLRDSVMGSDISYNDITDFGSYNQKYDPVSYTANGNTYCLTLRAKNDTVSYSKIDMYVDTKNYLISKMTLYAKGRDGDRAIKEFVMDKYQNVSGINIATYFEARDLRKKDSKTIVEYKDMKVNPAINKNVFTRNYLEH